MRTALFPLHQRLHARMTVFGGFEMPVSYAGIIEEHRAVRAAAGIFDLSHMGEFEVRGPRALELLERAFTNSAARLRIGQAQYTIMCAEDGGTIDDLIVYRLGDEHYMLCVNASNIAADREAIIALNSTGAEFRDLSDETALVAIQGPRAAALAAALADFPLAQVPRFGVAQGAVAGARCVAARTGYTGEDGFEFFTAPGDAAHLFDALLAAGRTAGAMACGLGARDTLRLEAGLPLYGHELDRATSPLEAGLDTFVKLKRDFVGAAALRAQRRRGPAKRLIGLRTDDARSIARQGYKLFCAGREVGVVTSGTFAPTLERPIAMGYRGIGEIHPDAAATTALEVEIRNRRAAATIVPLPFYRRPAAKR
ncbi:MAG TPA: glycine cleavage system aminomethyltransferase GcvT [Candidatus Binataceae bacterium]|nr:glycine cleavage system aminomethyltransferase GcvT [Candidatus Binataceae bacterium]